LLKNAIRSSLPRRRESRKAVKELDSRLRGNDHKEGEIRFFSNLLDEELLRETRRRSKPNRRIPAGPAKSFSRVSSHDIREQDASISSLLAGIAGRSNSE
jgi:hypothetical protein